MKALLSIIILCIIIMQTGYCQNNNPFYAIQTDDTGYEGFYVFSSMNKRFLKKTAPWFVQRFTITGGYFAPANKTNIQVDGSNGAVGSKINFEHDLGLTKTTHAVFGDLQWRIARRSRLDLNGFLVNRSAVHTLQKDITFGDSTYPANTSVRAFFNAGTWRLSYGFALFAKRNYEIGLRIGAHVLVNDIGIKAQQGNASYSRGHDFNFTKPLPDAGLWAGFALGQHFALNLEADYLDASAGSDLEGKILSYNAALTWRAFKPFQVAIGYKGFYFDINTQNREQFNGHFQWNSHGPEVTAALAFRAKAWKTRMDETFAPRRNKSFLKNYRITKMKQAASIGQPVTIWLYYLLDNNFYIF